MTCTHNFYLGLAMFRSFHAKPQLENNRMHVTLFWKNSDSIFTSKAAIICLVLINVFILGETEEKGGGGGIGKGLADGPSPSHTPLVEYFLGIYKKI